MQPRTRTILVTALLLFSPTPPGFAQAVDPSGHWVGAVTPPNMAVTVAFDLAKNGDGRYTGTFDSPASHISGMPLANVAIDGRSVTLVIKAGDGTSTFTGALSEDGKALAGTWSQNTLSFPFRVTRDGEAVFRPAPHSPSIDRELAGTWKGVLAAGGREMHLVLTMTNHPDGTATGTIASPEGTGMTLAVALMQEGPRLTIRVPAVGASFAGTLNAGATELAGTWTEGGSSLPLVLKKGMR